MLGKYIKKIKNNLFVKGIIKLLDDHGFEHAGYIAFLNLFSILPLCIILLSFIGLLYETELGIKIIRSVIKLLPDYALSVVGPQIDSIFTKPSIHLISFVSLGAIWTTSSSLEGMRTIFNKVYKVKYKPSFLITRITSILQFLLLITCTLFSIAAFIILPKIVHKLENVLHYTLPTMDHQYSNIIIMWIISILVIAMIYYSLTNKKLTFLEVLPGAVLTLILWYFSSYILSYYIANLADFNVLYGGLTGVIIILIFFYIVNIILIYGAIMNYLFKEKKPKVFMIYINFFNQILSTLRFKEKR
ncbi:MAG: YihY/virulence factor BrkB family protein [Alphaproteobacteria bacterium]|nr:YihY/virulence factor BrkB family protein [Alphaproteobacteria bacterium]